MNTQKKRTKTKQRRQPLRCGRRVSPAVIRLLNEILDHQVANRGTPAAFYRCYTYECKKMPAWVAKAERLLG